MGSQENYFGLVCRQNNNPKFTSAHLKIKFIIDVKKLMFGWPIQSKISAISAYRFCLRTSSNEGQRETT